MRVEQTLIIRGSRLRATAIAATMLMGVGLAGALFWVGGARLPAWVVLGALGATVWGVLRAVYPPVLKLDPEGFVHRADGKNLRVPWRVIETIHLTDLTPSIQAVAYRARWPDGVVREQVIGGVWSLSPSDLAQALEDWRQRYGRA